MKHLRACPWFKTDLVSNLTILCFLFNPPSYKKDFGKISDPFARKRKKAKREGGKRKKKKMSFC